MRRTIIKTGIQERLNDLMGTDTPDDLGVINDWSIQASMIENIKRVAKAVPGTFGDMVISGLRTAPGNAHYQFSVSSGMAITKTGEVLKLNVDLNDMDIIDKLPSVGDNDSVRVYIKFNEESKTDRQSNILNGDKVDIIWDGIVDANSIILSKATIEANDHVYIGSFIYSSAGESEHLEPFIKEVVTSTKTFKFRYGVLVDSKDVDGEETVVNTIEGSMRFKNGLMIGFTPTPELEV